MKTFSKKIVLSGSFGTGKSTLIEKLQQLGYPVIQENSRKVLNELGIKNDQLQGQQLGDFQKRLIEIQIQEEKRESFITDTSLIENLAYSTQLECYQELEHQVSCHLKPYDFIFFCPLLDSLEDDGVRYVDKQYQQIIDNNIRQLYKKYNYKIIELPIQGDTIEQQLQCKIQYILKHLENKKEN